MTNVTRSNRWKTDVRNDGAQATSTFFRVFRNSGIDAILSVQGVQNFCEQCAQHQTQNLLLTSDS